jgi:hypothetical protein
MSHQHRRSRDLQQQAAADPVPKSGAGPPSPGESERPGAEPGARSGGGDAGYHFEQLGDALAHERQTRSGPDEGVGVDSAPSRQRPAIVPPTDAEQMLMASLGIQFDGRTFRFAGYRYDRLADAVLYARQADGPT